MVKNESSKKYSSYSITISLIVSKIFYYSLKSGFIFVNLLNSNLLSTQFKYQLISPVIIILILFIYPTFIKKTDKA